MAYSSDISHVEDDKVEEVRTASQVEEVMQVPCGRERGAVQIF